jgi:hypothetical protein
MTARNKDIQNPEQKNTAKPVPAAMLNKFRYELHQVVKRISHCHAELHNSEMVHCIITNIFNGAIVSSRGWNCTGNYKKLLEYLIRQIPANSQSLSALSD